MQKTVYIHPEIASFIPENSSLSGFISLALELAINEKTMAHIERMVNNMQEEIVDSVYKYLKRNKWRSDWDTFHNMFPDVEAMNEVDFILFKMGLFLSE